MTGVAMAISSEHFYRGCVVEPAGDLASVQTPDGTLVACERLGPGLIEELAGDGAVYVHWVEAGFGSWMAPHDVRSLGRHAHLITVYSCDGRGNSKLVRRKVVTQGFEHNWTVELRPKNVVRVVSASGASWTFNANPFSGRIITPAWQQPPEDDDAEAITAAELARSR